MKLDIYLPITDIWFLSLKIMYGIADISTPVMFVYNISSYTTQDILPWHFYSMCSPSLITVHLHAIGVESIALGPSN